MRNRCNLVVCILSDPKETEIHKPAAFSDREFI